MTSATASTPDDAAHPTTSTTHASPRPSSTTVATGRTGSLRPGPEVRTRLGEAAPVGVQVGLDELGTPLAEVEWVVVDLETTGIGAHASITEIGAVRVRDGRVLDEFQSLVDPGEAISARITALTGITTSMVAGAPPIDAVYPAFARWAGLEDARGMAEASPTVVLVAHNAAFDIGFLRRAAGACGHDWPRPRVVDTLALARVALPRPMVANHRLQTLAGHFSTSPQRAHRALGDARTTVEVLNGLLDLLAPVGVLTVEDVSTVGAPVPARRRRRVAMTDDLPRGPGVYRFLDGAGAPLYVGSATNLRSRVRSYFTASESRARIRRMLDVAADVQVSPTSTVLEARVEELREIRTLHPLFNAASTHQDETRWVVATGDRLEVVPVLSSAEAPGALGPYRSRRLATRALEALAQTFPPEDTSPLVGPGRVPGEALPRVQACLRGEDGAVVDALRERMGEASAVEDFEGAARWKETLAAYLSGLLRRAAVLPVAGAERLVWAIHREDGGWVLHAASWGHLTHTFITPPRTSPLPWVEAVLDEDPLPAPGVFLSRTTWEEARLLSTSMSAPGARLVEVCADVPLGLPLDSPLKDHRLLEALGLAGARDVG